MSDQVAVRMPALAPERSAFAQVHGAMRRSRALSRTGLSERLFAHLFSGLVYAQIWEDPEVDMAAMWLGPGHRVVAIASGGCNALSYLTADPARVEAVDLNPAHVALVRLKCAAVAHLPDHASLRELLGGAGDRRNREFYERYVRPHLDPPTRRRFEQRGMDGRLRLPLLDGRLYRSGLLGRFIGWGHAAARLHGVDPRDLLKAGSIEGQRAFFERSLAPLFDKPLIRWLTGRRASLFGLGIPPQQYEALASGGSMAAVLRERLRKLACDFPLSENYFAWQAFGRGYGRSEDAPLPPYLRRENFAALRDRVGRLSVANCSYTDFLAAKPDASVDRFVLLDAQDWMDDGQLGALWQEITRTAAPGARVIFRTAAGASVLPGRVGDAILSRWDYREEESRAFHARDRSAIYGGFHLYVLRENAG